MKYFLLLLLLKHTQSKTKTEQWKQQFNTSMNDQIGFTWIESKYYYVRLKTLNKFGQQPSKATGQGAASAGGDCPRIKGVNWCHMKVKSQIWKS